MSVAGPAIVILWEPPAARHGPGCRGCLQLSIVTGVTTANVAPGEDEAHAPRLHSMGGADLSDLSFQTRNRCMVSLRLWAISLISWATLPISSVEALTSSASAQALLSGQASPLSSAYPPPSSGRRCSSRSPDLPWRGQSCRCRGRPPRPLR